MIKPDENQRLVLHYVLVYAVLLGTWVPMMGFFGGNIYLTSIFGFFIFVGADMLAHKILKVR